jgi:hypothetical protein
MTRTEFACLMDAAKKDGAPFETERQRVYVAGNETYFAGLLTLIGAAQCVRVAAAHNDAAHKVYVPLSAIVAIHAD